MRCCWDTHEGDSVPVHTFHLLFSTSIRTTLIQCHGTLITLQLSLLVSTSLIFILLNSTREWACKGEVRRKMNFICVLGFVVLRDVAKVFPVSSPSFVRKTTRKNRARSHSGARRSLMTKWDFKFSHVTTPASPGPVLIGRCDRSRVESCSSV